MAKRNLDRMREILLHIEAQDSDDGWVWTRNDAFWAGSDYYQVDLLKQAGFLEGDYQTIASVVPDQLRITNLGHDYLDTVRDDTVWNRTKGQLTKVGGGAALDVVKAVAVNIATQLLGLGTGQ